MVHCWTNRHEAMGYESAGDAIVALGRDGLKEIWVLSGRAGDPDDDSDPWTAADPLYDICMRDDGHADDHDFESPVNIVLEFK